MRRVLLCLFPVCTALAAAFILTWNASATMWGDPFVVADPAARPAVALDSTGAMHFVWANPDRGTIVYRRCASVNVCDKTERLPKLHGEATAPAIAIDSQNRATVVWEQKNGDKHAIYLAQRGSGGWSAPVRISDQPVSRLPAIAIGGNDVLQIVYESIQKNGRGIYLATFAQTATSPRLIELETIDDSTAQVAVGANPRIAVDANNAAHIVWNSAKKPFEVKYTYWNGGGFVFPKIVGDNQQDQNADISIDPVTNRVGILWETRKNNHAAFLLLENGVQVLRKDNIGAGADMVREPRLATDCGGRFHLVFQRARSARGDWNVYYRQFDPTNKTFTSPIRLTDSRRDDAQPALAVQRSGVLAFITGSGGRLSAIQGETQSVCHGDPTPTPTVTPTIPVFGWEHVTNQDARIVYTREWTALDNVRASDGNYARCGIDGNCRKGSSAKFSFKGGTRIEWQTAYANKFGKVDVYIDDHIFERIDLCDLNRNSSKLKFGTRTYILSGDANTEHSIEIKFLGDSSCSSKNRGYVVVDGFNVLR